MSIYYWLLGDAFRGVLRYFRRTMIIWFDYSNSGDGVAQSVYLKINDKGSSGLIYHSVRGRIEISIFIKNIIWKSDSEIFIKAYSNEDEKEYEYYKIL